MEQQFSAIEVTEIGERGEVAEVYFKDREILSEGRIQQVGSELISLAQEGQAKKIIVNLAGVGSVTAAFLGKLITLRRKSDQKGKKLVLCNIDPEVMVSFKIAKLEDYFTIVGTEQQAISA